MGRVDVLVDLLFGGAARVPPRRRTLRGHEILMHRGDPSHYVFFVADGGLIFTHDRADGSYIAADCAGPDCVCGLEDAVGGQPCTWSGRATTRSRVLCLLTDRMLHRLLADLPTALAVARYLCGRVRYFAEHAELLALERLTDRVRRTLRVLGTGTGPVRLRSRCRSPRVTSQRSWAPAGSASTPSSEYRVAQASPT